MNRFFPIRVTKHDAKLQTKNKTAKDFRVFFRYSLSKMKKVVVVVYVVFRRKTML